MGNRLATVDMGRKLGGMSPFGGAESPSNTTSPESRPIPPYQVVYRCIQPFGHNRHGPRIGGCAPFRGSWVPI